jgi:7-cyano-7-deazaguanine synthase
MSGGLDSTTLAYKAIEDGYDILPINIKYGQKNVVERLAFHQIFSHLKKEFPDRVIEYIDLDLESTIQSSIDLYQKIRDSKQVEKATDLEYYTPSRNLVFSVLAAMIGEIAAIAGGKTEVRIGLGVHKHVTYKNYWDITPEFVSVLNKVFELNDSINIMMYAPYSNSTKDEIVQDAIRMEVPYKLTWTCYQPKEIKDGSGIMYIPCLTCESCQERQLAGEKAGLTDINDYMVKEER